jgi:hypothetical protein
MSDLRLRTAGRYFAVPITALTIAAIGMVCASAASASASAAGTAPASAAASRAVSASAGASQASASSAQGKICLTNASNGCVSIQPGSGNAVLGSDLIVRNVIGTDQAGHWEAEIESAGFPGECLADTGLSAGVHANWQACGANGTVWILVPHSNGAYMESRFAVDRGTLLVLTANGTSPGTQLYVGNPSNPGSPFWQTWTFFPA